MTPREAAPRQARDVMAFGQEIGRVLSDGRIVGRAEPFAKVFQSSRLVKQAVGLTAWGILEDIALDATLDVEGLLVAETSARRIAENLGLNQETVSRRLGRLREFGFVLHEEVRQQDSGRYETARYVLDPSACLERFTTTPRPRHTPSSGPRTESRTLIGDGWHPHRARSRGPCNARDPPGSVGAPKGSKAVLPPWPSRYTGESRGLLHPTIWPSKR